MGGGSGGSGRVALRLRYQDEVEQSRTELERRTDKQSTKITKSILIMKHLYTRHDLPCNMLCAFTSCTVGDST